MLSSALLMPVVWLYLLPLLQGTPIGNLEDMSFRAIRILQGVSLILAEDTRHTRKLLEHFSIRTPTLSCHEHNERQRQELVLQRLQQGEVGAAACRSEQRHGMQVARRSRVQYSTVQYSTLQCSAVQCIAVQCSTGCAAGPDAHILPVCLLAGIIPH
jgi:hypothetical protein